MVNKEIHEIKDKEEGCICNRKIPKGEITWMKMKQKRLMQMAGRRCPVTLATGLHLALFTP
jgi:hypothetical protein